MVESIQEDARCMVVAGALIIHEATGKILLLRRASDFNGGQWEIVYGRKKPLENFTDGLKREVFEETGIDDLEIGSPLRLWQLFRGEANAENEMIGTTFYCTTGQDEIRLAKEHSEYRWATLEEAMELVKVDGIREDIASFMRLQARNPARMTVTTLDGAHLRL